MSEKKTKDEPSTPPSDDARSMNAASHGDAPADHKEARESTESGLDLGDVGAKLRELYGTWREEPIPDRFTKLLDKLNEEKKPEGS